MLERISLLVAFLAGLLALLPRLALLVVMGAIAWVGLRFVFQLVQLLLA